MFLTSCAHSSGDLKEAPIKAAPTSRSVQLSRECEHLAANVNDPEIPDHPDPWRTIGEYEVALGTANDNIDATRACQVRQRVGLAKRK